MASDRPGAATTASMMSALRSIVTAEAVVLGGRAGVGRGPRIDRALPRRLPAADREGLAPRRRWA